MKRFVAILMVALMLVLSGTACEQEKASQAEGSGLPYTLVMQKGCPVEGPRYRSVDIPEGISELSPAPSYTNESREDVAKTKSVTFRGQTYDLTYSYSWTSDKSSIRFHTYDVVDGYPAQQICFNWDNDRITSIDATGCYDPDLFKAASEEALLQAAKELLIQDMGCTFDLDEANCFVTSAVRKEGWSGTYEGVYTPKEGEEVYAYRIYFARMYNGMQTFYKAQVSFEADSYSVFLSDCEIPESTLTAEQAKADFAKAIQGTPLEKADYTLLPFVTVRDGKLNVSLMYEAINDDDTISCAQCYLIYE